MKIIFGLGNPESSFAGTRHNAGFELVERLRRKFAASPFKNQAKLQAEISKEGEYIFAKPTTYMNLSGQAVRAVLDYYQGQIANLYVIHDDLDLELGSNKIQFGTGPQGHNGLLSIYQHLGSKNFWHVRVGVDSRKGSRIMDSSDYVLQRFSADDQAIFDRSASELTEELHGHIQMQHS